MARRSILWFGVFLLAGIALLLLGRSCGREDASLPSDARPAEPQAAAEDDPSKSNAAAAARTVTEQRQRAMSTAVDTVHRYLAALSGKDRAIADAFWVDDRPPAASNEADLRTIEGLRALRIQNRMPKPLDSAPVPAALEIPVELRVGVDDAPGRRYRGWYRLRSLDPAQGEWEITSASLKLEAQ